MKFVHVEDFFHADAGYQVNLLSRLQRQQGHEVTVVTADLAKIPTSITGFFGTDPDGVRDRAFEAETGVVIQRIPLLGYYSGRAIFHPKILKVVQDERPDVVFVHGEDTLTGIVFIWLSDLLPYPLVLDCHMLEMASVNRFRELFRSFYRRFVTPKILNQKIPLIRVVDSDFVQKCLGIPLSHTELLSFGTDTSYFKPDSEARQAVRAKLGLSSDAFVVLYAGKLDEAKGGLFLAETLKDRIDAGGRPIEFLIIGTTDGTYGSRVDSVFANTSNTIVRLPTQRYFDLAQYYQAADLAVFPRQCSLSFFEAQACGLPVLFEINELNTQRITHRNAFTFIAGDIDDFRRQIRHLASLPIDTYDAIRARARAFVLDGYDYVPIADRFTEVMIKARHDWQRMNRSTT